MELAASHLVLLLVSAGVLIGIFAAVVGGAFFFSIPLFQLLFSTVSFGTIVGNLKLASLVRGLGTIYTTRSQIAYADCFRLSGPIVVGSFIGATCIAKLSQQWIFPVMIIAVLAAEFAPRLAEHLNKRHHFFISLALGIYTGFLGAGIGILLVSYYRLRYPEPEKIAWSKIQARFIEFLATLVAVAAHILSGNIIFVLWFYYGMGSLVGGAIGGVILSKLTKASPKVQMLILRLAFVFALLVSARVFFGV